LQREMDKFQEGLDSPKAVTPSAVTHARKNLQASAFSHLNTRLLSRIYPSSKPQKTCNEIQRILAVDGTTLALPDTSEIAKRYGRATNKRDAKRPLATVSSLFDVVNRLIVDASLNPAYTSENHLALNHLRFISKGDLLLFDRGYRCQWLMQAILNTGANFLIRVSAFSRPEFREFYNSSKRDGIITLTPTSWTKGTAEKVGIEVPPLKVRIVKVLLESGETELLITTLFNKENYPLIIFRQLYFLRWGIEESYKVLKTALEVERFTGKTPHAIEQDFYAAILLHNLQAVLSEDQEVGQKVCQISQKRKQEQQVNRTYALFHIKRGLVDLMLGEKIEQVVKYISQKVTSSLLPIRENRAYKRKKNERRVAKSTMTRGISP